MSELTELIKEAAKRKKKKQLSALKKHYRTAVNWIKKNPGKSTGLGALGVGAGYGGYEAIKHLLNREKKSSLFDENVVDELANEIIKEAKATKVIAKAAKKKKKAAPTLAKTYKNTINWIKKNPGKSTGLGALGVGAGYGGYEAIKHLLNKEKESSILDELSGEIIKEAAKKKKKELSALARAYKWVKRHPGKSTGLGALGVGAGYGGYEAIKHLLNKEKESSILDELSGEIIKEAAKKKKKELSALARAYKWVKRHPGKSTGLGALGVGAGYGGYEAIKHLLDKEKKSSLFDEDLVDELANEIIKQAAEDSVYNELLADADDDIVDEDEYEDYFDEDEDEDIDEDEDADEDLDEDLDEEELD